MNAAWMPVIGGGLLGLGLAIPLVFEGYSEGACGLVSGVASGPASRRVFRGVMLLTMALTGAVYLHVQPSAFDDDVRRPLSVLVLAGALSAIGTRLANGCTSGHGILGVGRGAPRSLLALALFTLAAMATVALSPLEPAPEPARLTRLMPEHKTVGACSAAKDPNHD